jgi:hypothetical protein
MAKEAKALLSKCPNCSAVTAQPVESYRLAIRAGDVRTFHCGSCGAEYVVPNAELSFGVIKQLTPRPHPLHVTN